MEKVWRLILDIKHDGYHNMAVDEVILEGYSQYKIPTLRLYGWNKPFISLGYNQKPKEVLNSYSKVPFVRRITGGSAILHDQEITYSMVCSLNDLDLFGTVKESYGSICSFLKDFYFKLGLKTLFAKESLIDNLGEYSDSCFSCCQHFDLVLKGKKIGGNAQRRKKNIIFQHGSIPQVIDFSAIKRSIKGSNDSDSLTTCLNKALSKDTDFYYLQNLLTESFSHTFGVKFTRSRLSKEEAARVGILLEEKYTSDDWNLYRNKVISNAKV